MKYKVKDLKLAEQGRKKYEWANEHMPVLAKLKEHYTKTKPLKGLRIAGAIHVTKETAVLVKTLQELGAQVAWAGCNPLSTQDDIAAYLAKQGVNIYAWRGCDSKEYYWCIDQIIKTKPNLTMDDGCDVVVRIHELAKKIPKTLEGIIGGTEETTTGVHRLRAMHAAGELEYPIVAVNDAETKWDFDNVYGTGQGTLDGILRATSVLITGKTFIVAGYGHCGKGVAMRAKGAGAKVVVTEVDPIQALRAKMEGYDVMPMSEAAKIGDIFITATGVKDIITNKHFLSLKDGAILSNTGHFNVEVRVDQLEELAVKKEETRPNTVRYDLPNGKHVYLLAEGRLVNLSAAEGHPSEVMDLSFSNQVLSLIRLTELDKADHHPDLWKKVLEIPKEQDVFIAKLKIASMGISIDNLTKEQENYLKGYSEGTK